MGSGSSKVVIKRVTPEVTVNYNAVNGVEPEDGLFNDVDVNKPEAEEATDTSEKKKSNKDKPSPRSPSPPPEIQQEEEKKYESETLKETEEKLKTRGFTDPVLAQYCDETPNLLEEFVKLYEQVKKIKTKLKEHENFAPLLVSPYTSISSAYGKDRPQKIKKGEFLSDIGFGEVCRDVYDKLLTTYPEILSYDKENDEENKEDEAIKKLVKAQSLLSTFLVVAINYSDLCDAVNLAFNKAGMTSRLVNAVEKLKDCIPDHVKYMDITGNLSKKTERGKILSRILGTLHNLSKRVPTRVNFQECNAVEKILPLASDKVTLYATKALLMLAYLIDENNNELIMANKGPIKFLISSLDRAIKASNHRYLGFSSAELAEGLAQIAINDSNKKMIGSNNVIPILKRMMEKPIRDEETIEALELLWVLAFDEDNIVKILATDGLLDLIKSSKDHENAEIKKAASGALWEIEGKNAMGSSSDLKNMEGKRHVMISYQWDVQKILIQVKNKLQRAGFKVWMDLEQMGGSTLEAMAKAVENSAVVLVCVSQKYKESSNCRSEAEYAHQLNKDIVPLMMESNYKPDGWLGIVMGSKFWIDFSNGMKKVDSSVKDLTKELGTRGKVDSEDLIEAINVDTVDASPDQAPKIDISGWTNKDVMAWIQTFGLEVKKKNSLKMLDGPLLRRLHSLREESSDYYYLALREDVGIYNVYNILLFTDELEKLIG